MTCNKIIVSAPGKVIMHGEHAVVYGKSAVAASVNLRSYLVLEETDTGVVHVDLPAVNLNLTWPIEELREIAAINTVNVFEPDRPSQETLDHIMRLVFGDGDCPSTADLAAVAFLYLYTALCQSDGLVPSVKIKVISRLPVSAGLGSSASFSVCLAAALLLKQGLVSDPLKAGWCDKDLDLINKWAFQGERILHGNPSGIDNAVATFGGAIKLQSGNITKLDRVPKLRILLIATSIPRSTKMLVANVREKYNKFPDVLGPVMDSIDAISERAQKCYIAMTTDPKSVEEHLATLESLIDMNQHLLQVMGVSHPSLDKICLVTSTHNLHSKLTGAGGGGCAFTLLRPGTDSELIDKVKADLEPTGFICWETDIGVEGVTVLDQIPEDLS